MSESPDFLGFPQEGMRFLADLRENNNREWFEAHKETYREQVLAPAQDLAFALGERLKKDISPGIVYDTAANGSGSVLRIYRDLRFSKDKRPYNTHVRLVFWEGARKKMENPSFFVRINPDGAGVYSGIHVFPKPVLAAYREAVVDEQLGSELASAIAAVKRAGPYAVGGKHYKRVPRGYAAEHPRADLLRYNGLWAHTTDPVNPAAIVTTDLIEVCLEHCRNMAPLHHWLVQVGRQLER
jgi:uncharacterized protein (TIGR02453 family)